MFKYYADSVELENVIPIIEQYQQNETVYIHKMFDYYNGKQAILSKETSEDRPNNQVVTNYCKQIVDTYQGYINIGAATTDNDVVANNLSKLSDVLRDALICGISYFLVYYDNGDPVFAKLNPASTLVIRSTEISHKVIGAATWNYYTKYEDGFPKQYVELYVYDAYNYEKYVGLSLQSLKKVEDNPHYFKSIPIVEAHCIPNRVSLYDGVIGLQDSYNLIDSSYLDSRETYSNAYLIIRGIGLDKDTAASLIDSENKVINLPIPEADAKYLIKEDNAADIISMLDNIKRRIFTITCTPDFNDTQFSQQSGMALKHKLTAFINNINNIEEEFRGIIDILEDILGYYIEFEYNSIIPTDLDSIVDMIVKLNGIVSRETLLSQLPFINNVEEELKRVTNSDNI